MVKESEQEVTPSKIEFEVGKTSFQQRITLTRIANSSTTRPVWEIRKFAANQRDDDVTIFNLDGETILRMAEAVRGVNGFEGGAA